MGQANPLDELLDAVFPRRCPVCGVGVRGSQPCERHRLILSADDRRCARCANRLPEGVPDGFRCGACARRPPAFQSALTLGDYAPGVALRDWVLALKHGHRPELADALSRALFQRHPQLLEPASDPTWIVPVPLHPWRRLERGYDQALLLARGVALMSRVPLGRFLRRRRWSPPQGAPGSSSRSANVGGVFALRTGREGRLKGARIWLVDDVMTSGATASECARVLRRAGSGPVKVLVIARAGLGKEHSPGNYGSSGSLAPE